jgi:DeoR family transcriptional regulator, suf operon transcriptional repressor
VRLRRWNEGSLESTAAQVVRTLRGRSLTVEEIASALGLSGGAVRAHLATLERDGLVRQNGTRRGVSKPARTYGLTPESELLFSRVYVPLLGELLRVLSTRMAPREFDATFREVGRGLTGRRPRGTLRQRAEAACALWNELGGMMSVGRERGRYVIRSLVCPLSAVARERPEACVAMECLLSAFVDAPVSNCCNQAEERRCCFELGGRAGRTA